MDTWDETWTGQEVCERDMFDTGNLKNPKSYLEPVIALVNMDTENELVWR